MRIQLHAAAQRITAAVFSGLSIQQLQVDRLHVHPQEWCKHVVLTLGTPRRRSFLCPLRPLLLQAFQELAHPEYGIMMVDYRPVDCDTHKPIQFDPGYISDTIYTVSGHLGFNQRQVDVSHSQLEEWFVTFTR